LNTKICFYSSLSCRLWDAYNPTPCFFLILVFKRDTYTYSEVRNVHAVQRAYQLCVSSRHHKGAPRNELKRFRLLVESRNVKILKFISIAVRVAIFRLRPNLHRVLSYKSVYTFYLHVFRGSKRSCGSKGLSTVC